MSDIRPRHIYKLQKLRDHNRLGLKFNKGILTEILSSQPSSIVNRPEMFAEDSCILVYIKFDRAGSSQKKCGVSFVDESGTKRVYWCWKAEKWDLNDTSFHINYCLISCIWVRLDR